MGKYTDSSCKICRREGGKLFLKGERCSTEKCAFNRRTYSPGQHGQSRAKLSDYGLQLREKQKVKKIYGLFERQFRLYFERASSQKGVTGYILLSMLERRLDNVVFRLCLASSRAQARQMVYHGLVLINDKKVDIPSYQVKVENKISIRAGEAGLKRLKERFQQIKERGIPGWLNLDEAKMIGTVVRMPERNDVQFPIKEQLIIELYSK